MARSSTFISHNDAELQEIRFQHMLSKLLGQIMNVQDELRPRTKSMKDLYTEASKDKIASTAVSYYMMARNLTREKEQAISLMRNFSICLLNSTQNYAEYLKKRKIFGFWDTPILEGFRMLAAETVFDKYFKKIIKLALAR